MVNSSQTSAHLQLTLHHQVDNDGVEAQGVCCSAGIVPRILGFDRTDYKRAIGQDLALVVCCHWNGSVLAEERNANINIYVFLILEKEKKIMSGLCVLVLGHTNTNLSLVHLIVGAGSPTELQGKRTSFIHGVVTVPPKDRILAGTANTKP